MKLLQVRPQLRINLRFLYFFVSLILPGAFALVADNIDETVNLFAVKVNKGTVLVLGDV